MSDGLDSFGAPNWRLALCLACAWVAVALLLMRGIRSVGRTAAILAPFPYVLLTAFLIQSLITDSEGAVNGVLFLLTPQWKQLTKPAVWYDAVSQVFFSLSLLEGGLITLTSFNKFHYNIRRDAVLIPAVDTLTSIYAAFSLFAVLGVLANRTGVAVSQVIRGASGLAFITFSEAVAMMPLPQLWSVLLFLLLVCLGLGTQYVLVETAITALTDEFPQVMCKRRLRLILGFCGALFVCGVPLTFHGGLYLQLMLDKFSSSYSRLFLAALFVVALVWVYGFRRVSHDIRVMTGSSVRLYWHVLWRIITPQLVLVILICALATYTPLTVTTYFVTYKLPVWASVLGWLVCAVQIAPVFVCAALAVVKAPPIPLKERLERVSSPTSQWRPALDLSKLAQQSGGVKAGRDIGGIDSIFSATVGNNVLVRMATLAEEAKPTWRKKLNKTTSLDSPSADVLARNLDTDGAGPIMFVEDGETFMLVKRRKDNPLMLDQSTQTPRPRTPARANVSSTSASGGLTGQVQGQTNKTAATTSFTERGHLNVNVTDHC